MNGPRQLLLDIRPDAEPGFHNFVTAANAELVARLQALGESSNFDQIYLWGPPGSGRSHLLAATCHHAQALHRPVVLVSASELGSDVLTPPGALLIVDDVEQLTDAAQITLFRLFNAARLVGLALLLAGPKPPLQLAMREDLRTRIGAALVYEVKPLTDFDKAEVLRGYATDRGLRLDETLIDYLLRHCRRDLPSLIGAVEKLDRISLEQKRPASLALLREIVQEDLEKE